MTLERRKKEGGSSRRQILSVGLVGVALVAIRYGTFSAHFPNQQGALGHDWAYFLPQLLDGYVWSLIHGYFSVPCFTPSFCGGVPKFPNSTSLYFSIPQILTVFAGGR